MCKLDFIFLLARWCTLVLALILLPDSYANGATTHNSRLIFPAREEKGKSGLVCCSCSTPSLFLVDCFFEVAMVSA